MMVYKYRLHDPDSGKVLYEGTAADLAAQGVVVSEKVCRRCGGTSSASTSAAASTGGTSPGKR